MQNEQPKISNQVSTIVKIIVVISVIILIYIDSANVNFEVPGYIFAGLFGIAYGLDKRDIEGLLSKWIKK